MKSGFIRIKPVTVAKNMGVSRLIIIFQTCFWMTWCSAIPSTARSMIVGQFFRFFSCARALNACCAAGCQPSTARSMMVGQISGADGRLPIRPRYGRVYGKFCSFRGGRFQEQ